MEFHGEQLDVTAGNNNNIINSSNNNNNINSNELAPNAAVNANSTFNSSFTSNHQRAILKELHINDINTQLSPLPTKAFSTTKLTPVPTRTNPSTPFASPVLNTTATIATNHMEMNTSAKQLQLETVAPTNALNTTNGLANSSNVPSKFVGLQEFDESTIPELPGSLNPNLEEQLKISFEDGLIPMLTANVGAEPIAADKATENALQEGQLNLTNPITNNVEEVHTITTLQNGAPAPIVEMQNKRLEEADDGPRESCPGDITFENEAMDIDISFSDADVALEYAAAEQNELMSAPATNVTLNMNFVEHVAEEKPKDSALNCVSDKNARLTFAVTPRELKEEGAVAMEQTAATATEQVPDKNARLTFAVTPSELKEEGAVVREETEQLLDKNARLTFAVTPRELKEEDAVATEQTATDQVLEKNARLTFAVTPSQQNQENAAGTEQTPKAQALDTTIELPPERVNNENVPAGATETVAEPKRDFGDVVLQAAAEKLVDMKLPATPLAIDAKLNLTLDMTGSFCSARGSVPASPAFPIKNTTSAGQFPRSPKSARAKESTFIEHSEHARKSLESTFENIQFTPAPTQNTLNQTLDGVNAKRTIGGLNKTYNGTASEDEHAANGDRRRTFNVATPTMSAATKTTFPVNKLEPVAADTKSFNQSDADRRRTFNLTDVAEHDQQQQRQEEQLEDELHNDNSIEPMDVDVSMSMSSTPALTNGISSTPQWKPTPTEQHDDVEQEQMQSTEVFRSNSPPLPTHQSHKPADAMSEYEKYAAADKEAIAAEVAQQEAELKRADNAAENVVAAAVEPRSLSPAVQAEVFDTPNEFRQLSSSPPLPTHQAKRHCNEAKYEPVAIVAAAKERSLSPPLPAQKAQQLADQTIEYGAAGDGPTPGFTRSASPPLPAQQRKSQANAMLEEYPVSPTPPTQQPSADSLAAGNGLSINRTPSPGLQQSEMNSSYCIARSTQPLLPSMQEHTPTDCSPTLATAFPQKQPMRQSILTTIQDFQQQPPPPAAPAIKKRPPIHTSETAELFGDTLPTSDGGDKLSAKEKSKKHLKDEKDIFDDMFAKPFGGCSAASAGNHFDFQQLQQQQEFQDEFSNQSNFILNSSDFDYLLTKGNNNVQVDRSSLLLRFDPLLGVPVPLNQAQQQQQQQQLQQILAANCNTNATANILSNPNNQNNNKLLSPTAEEGEEDSASTAADTSFVLPNNNKKPIGIPQPKAITSETYKSKREPTAAAAKPIKTTEFTREEPEKKHASMSVDIIKDMNIENDCNKTYENSNIQQSDEKQINYKMDELEKKIQNEVMKTEDIEKKLKEAEQREEALIKRITEKDKTISKMNGVIEAYEKAIAELIAEKEQLIQNYEKQLQEVKADRDSNYHHLTSLETTFSDLHVKYEKSKEMTSQLKSSEESLLAEKRQNLENLRLQEQRYEKMKNHAMQQLEIANKKLESLTKEHAIETTKLKALLKKEEISRASINEQLQQKSRENAELVKICDELINGQGS